MSKTIPVDAIYEWKSLRRMLDAFSFKGLLDSGKFSDVKLVVGDKEFRVHKNILSARSSVFSEIFEFRDCLQVQSDLVITNISYEAMHQVLTFIYSGWVNVTEETVLDLLHAADTYKLKGLKEICEEKLIEKISFENVGKMLLTVDRFNTEGLKWHLFEFMRDHTEDVFKTEAYNSSLKLLSGNTLIRCKSCLLERKLMIMVKCLKK